MTKIATLFLVFMVWSQLGIAQEPAIKFGEIYASSEFMPYKILGENETDYVVICQGKGRVLYDINCIIDLKIALIDKSTLSISKMLSFPEFQGDDISKKGTTIVKEKILRGDTLHIITTTWDKNQKDYAIHVWSFNPKTLVPFTTNARLITRIPDIGKEFINSLRVIEFDRTLEFAILYPEPGNKKKSRLLNFIHLNHQFSLLHKQVLKHDENHNWLGMKDIEADSAGNFFILSSFAEASASNSDDSRWLGLQMIPANGGEAVTTTLKTQKGNAFNGCIGLNSSGDLFVCGYYSGITEPKDGEKEVIGGTFIAKILPQTAEVLKINEKELTQNQKKALQLPYSSLNPVKLMYSRMNELKILNLFIDDEDNITMVGVSENTTTYSNGSYTTTQYESNSISTAKFSASGNVLWHTITPKSSLASAYKGMLDPLVYFINGTVILLFNDHIKNIQVLNNLASGENTDSYTSYASAERAKPVDLPPSDSDATSDYSIWQQENTIVRKTIIDSTGKWKVSWIDLKTENENKKNAILEGSMIYSDSDDNIISFIYPKYSELTKSINVAIVKILNSNNR